jgi:hypothetical protein
MRNTHFVAPRFLLSSTTQTSNSCLLNDSKTKIWQYFDSVFELFHGHTGSQSMYPEHTKQVCFLRQKEQISSFCK